MALEITGKVIQILAEQKGTGKNGPWSKLDFIIETQEQFPRKICFSAWNDKVGMIKSLTVDSPVKVSFNAESREFNGKWYTDLRIWKVESGESSSRSAAPSGLPDDGLEPLMPENDSSEPDDLPF
jgi:hypothetical protein